MNRKTELKTQDECRAASKNGGAATHRQHHQEHTDIDWDAAIARLRAMFDDLDRKYGRP